MAINAWLARQSKKTFQRSVIPCNADKSPRIQWAQFQSTLITDDLIDLIFAQSAPAMAVITGGHLLCVDLDSQDATDSFRSEFPDLWNTRRNRTVRGFHLFYRVDTTENWTNKRAAGVDFLHEGCYALLPPSPGKTPDQAGPLRPLSAAEYGSILTHFQLRENEVVSWQPDELLTQSQCTPAGLIAVYQERRQALGSRNAALYQAASYARRSGLDQAATESALLDIYSQSPAPPGHRRESTAARLRAGQATIASAYTGQAYAVKRLVDSLPAAAHQIMSQRKQTAAARLLDKVYRAGFRGPVTQARLQGLDTDWGMRRTVEFLESSGLAEITQSPPGPPAQRYAGYPADNTTEKQNVFVSGQNQQKPPNVGGRPLYLYQIPTAREVCDWLGISHWWIDPIDLSALNSKTPLRLALLTGLLSRIGAQGRCSLSWQASVFGVNRKTIKRWFDALGVISQHPGRALSGFNLSSVLPDESRRPDCWIQDNTGKKYPAIRVVAAKLWSQGKTGLTFHYRYDPNCYYLPTARPNQQKPLDWCSQSDSSENSPRNSYAFSPEPTIDQPPGPVSRSERLLALARAQYGLNWHFDGPPAQLPAQTPYVPKWGAGAPGAPLADDDQEAAAIHLYNELNRRARPDKRIRADVMRGLVTQYGVDQVRTAVKRLTGRINNPVGYVICCLARERNNDE